MMAEITGTAAIRSNFMASHICMVKVPHPWFFGSCFSGGSRPGDSALVFAHGYAQGNIHRSLMAINFEGEDEERS
jgi:hypothetical protein